MQQEPSPRTRKPEYLQAKKISISMPGLLFNQGLELVTVERKKNFSHLIQDILDARVRAIMRKNRR
jgi:hypothetical protein